MRIFLDEPSTGHLQTMLKEMRKHRGVTMSPSELGSWVLEFFFKTQFEKARPQIAKHFTDFKKLVRDNLRSASSQEELIHYLRDSLAATQTNRGTKKTANVVDVKANKEEVKDK